MQLPASFSDVLGSSSVQILGGCYGSWYHSCTKYIGQILLVKSKNHDSGAFFGPYLTLAGDASLLSLKSTSCPI